MRRIVLAALLSTLVTASLAVAMPAWAANDEKRQSLPYTGPVLEFANPKAFQVCAGSGTPSVICAMKYVAEDDALTLAQSSLKACSEGTASHQAHHCTAILAYIKQRWGY